MLEIQMLDPKTFIPYKNNAKLHPPEQVEIIARSIDAFGFDQPIVLDKNRTIIKGHGRHLASLLRNYTKVPAVIREDLSVQDCKAARLADNQSSKSDYSVENLAKDLEDLHFDNFDLSLTGFTPEELAELMKPEKVEDLPAGEGEGKSADKKDSVCQPNDIWICGNISLTLDLDADEDCKLADKMIQSWQKNTQRDAIRDEDGETFNNLNRQLK